MAKAILPLAFVWPLIFPYDQSSLAVRLIIGPVALVDRAIHIKLNTLAFFNVDTTKPLAKIPSIVILVH